MRNEQNNLTVFGSSFFLPVKNRKRAEKAEKEPGWLPSLMSGAAGAVCFSWIVGVFPCSREASLQGSNVCLLRAVCTLRARTCEDAPEAVVKEPLSRLWLAGASSSANSVASSGGLPVAQQNLPLPVSYCTVREMDTERPNKALFPNQTDMYKHQDTFNSEPNLVFLYIYKN